MNQQNNTSQSSETSPQQGPVGQGNYTVKQSDCMESIAYEHGFFWETLWNLPENAELKQKRRDPNVLLPGDKVYIPELRVKEESSATKKRHRFRRKGVPAKVIMRFEVENEPRAHEPYILEIDGILSKGETDEEGAIEVFIPPDAKKGKITFPKTVREYELALGGLDPITERSGVQGRLMNLGFFAGPVDDKMSPDLEQALRAFQEKFDLEATGKLDEDTRRKIEQVFGG